MIPEGQKLNIGAVGQQLLSSLAPKYRGGEDQVILPRNWSMDWVKSVKDGKTGKGIHLMSLKLFFLTKLQEVFNDEFFTK